MVGVLTSEQNVRRRRGGQRQQVHAPPRHILPRDNREYNIREREQDAVKIFERSPSSPRGSSSPPHHPEHVGFMVGK